MADDTNMVDNQVDTNTPAPAEPTPVETRARELGWVPKEEYSGDETNWLDAGEFVRRQPLFEKIEKQNRELKEIKRTMAKFAEHHAKVREAEYQRAIEDLKAKKVAAFEDGDAKAIVKIDDELATVQRAKDQFVAEQAQQIQEEAATIHPEFAAWTNRNPWYATNPEMKAYADALGVKIAQTFKPDGSRYEPNEVLKEVEKRVKSTFKDQFVNPNREKPGAVEGTSSRGSSKNSSSYQPNEFEKRVAEKFVRQGLYKNVDEYYKELKLINGKS